MVHPNTLSLSAPVPRPRGRRASACESMSRPELHRDAQWLAAYRRGDADALDRIVRTYGPELREILTKGLVTRQDERRARYRPADEDEMAEITNEVFLRAISERTRQNYEGVAPFFPYLARICRNVVVDRFHRAQRERRMFESDQVMTASGEWSRADRTAASASGPVALGRSPERSATRRAMAAALAEFLADLTDEERALLRVYYDDDASQRQAAEQLGMNRNRVRAVISKLRTRMLRHLEAEGWLDDANPDDLKRTLQVLLTTGVL